MFARALIVLLLVLNVGVAAWWALRPAPPPVAITQPEGIAQLQLLSHASLPAQPPAANSEDEAATPPADVPEPAATQAPPAPAPATEAIAAAPRCFSFGPFATAESATAARTRLQPRVQRSAVRTRIASPARGWWVYLPPLPSDEAIKAMVKRITDAGFSDYLVMHDGDAANAISLGRYGNEATARRRVETLRAAGFTATRAEPVGGGEDASWLDVAAAPGFDAAAAQALVAAPGRQALDCTRM